MTNFTNIKTLVALGVTSLALMAAGPASAEDSEPKPPTDANGKKSCALYEGDEVIGWVGHGGTWTDKGGRLTTKCVDGEWVVIRTAPSGTTYSGGSTTTGTYSAG